MQLSSYQQAVLRGSLLRGEDNELVVSTLGLAGEAGEVADLVKKSFHPGNDAINVPRVVEELGDVLWYLTHLAGLLGYSVEELASMNYNKLSERYPNNYPLVVE